MKLPAWLKLLKGSLTLSGDPDGDNDQVELLLAEPVGFNPETSTGMTSKEFGETMSYMQNRKVKLLVNSLGGRIDEGLAMYHMMLAHGNVEVCVIGFAASMAATLVQAGAKRTMCKGTLMVVHNPYGGQYGQQDDVEASLETLKRLKSSIVDIFKKRTKMSGKKISELMDATTSMTAEEALEMGFIDEIVGDSPAWNDMNHKAFFNTCRQLASAPKCAVGDESGNPASTENKPKSMKNITAALAKLGLVSSADLSDETAIVTELNTRFAPINSAAAEVAGLRTKVQAHEAALKTRVENRVQKAIDGKLIKAERKDALVAAGLTNEASLDFLDDISVAAPPAAVPGRRGAPPLPAKAQGEQTKAEQLQELRDRMSDEKDPKALAEMALQARALRGCEDLFAPTALIPATKAASAAAAK